MSRVTKIGGAALLTLVSLGVLAALAQTPQKPPTELYVRTVPSGAAITVDGKQQGASPKLFKVEPGQHTVIARLEGYQPETKKVTVREGRIKRVILELQKRPAAGGAPPKAGSDETGWGTAVEGVQCRLRPEKVAWELAEVRRPNSSLRFKVDFRNRSKEHRAIEPPTITWHVEWDGESHGANYTTEAPLWELPPGGELRDRPFNFPRNTFLDLEGQPTVGWHTVRAAFLIKGIKGSATRVFSNPVKIEILPDKPAAGDEKTAWGPAVEGVQIRLWAEKKTWRVDEEVILKVDCRNQGKRDLMLDDRTGCFDVYVGYRMYSPDPNITNLSFPAPFGPGRHYNGRPIGLGRYVGLKLAPGKHTIRVVLKAAQNTVRPLEGPKAGTTMNKGELLPLVQEIEKRLSQLPVVVSSNPIEIEIVAAKPKTAPAPVAPPPPKLAPRKLFSASHGAGAGILAVAFSPDGLTVAAVDEKGKITLCDARSGGQRWGRAVLTPEEKKLLLYEDREGRIHSASIAYSPDGYTLAVAADAVVRLYDAQSGRLLRALEDKQLVEQLKALKRPPATVSRELELLKTVPHAHGRVYSVAFSPDGKLLATSGSHLIRADGSSVINAENATPGKLKLWDAKTGELKRDLGEHYSVVRSVAFSGDGKILASIGSHRPSWSRSVRLWDPQTGAVKSVLPIALGGGPEGPVALSPDGKLVAAGALVSEPDPGDEIDRLGRGSCRLLVWNAHTGALLLNHRMPGLVTSLSFSADGKTLAAAVDGQGVTLWDPQTLTQKGEIQPSTDATRNVQVAFSPTGNLLAVGTKNKKRGLLTVWQIDQPGDQAAAAAKRFLAALVARDVAQMQSLIVETPPRWTADAMPGLVKEIRDEVFVNVPHLLTEIRETLVQDDWAAVRIDGPVGGPQGKYLWLVLRRGPDGWRACYMDDSDPKSTLEKWFKEFISQDGDEQPPRPQQQPADESGAVEESDPAEESVSAEESGPVAEVLGGFPARELYSASHGADAGVLAVAFSPDGKTVAAVDEAAKVILRNAWEPRQTTSLNTGMGGLGRRIMSLDLLSPDEKKLLLNKDRPQQIHSGAVAFSPDGKTLAVGGGPVVKLFDAATGRVQLALEDKQLIEEIKKLGGHSEQLDKLAAAPHAHGYVDSVAFSPDGTLLATSGGHIIEASGATPGHIKLWDAKTGELKRDLGEHFGAVRSVAFSPDGKILSSAGNHPPRWTASVRSWDPQTGAIKSIFFIPRGDPWSVAFSPDGKLMAAGGIIHEEEDDPTSGTLLVWNAQTGARLLSRPLPGVVASIAFSADGKTLATGEYDKGVTLWDPETLKPKGEIKPATDLPRDVKGTVCVAFSPSGSLLAIGAENERHGFVTVWEIGQPEDRSAPRGF